MRPALRLAGVLLVLLVLLAGLHGFTHHDGGPCVLCVPAALPELPLPGGAGLYTLPDVGHIHPGASIPAVCEGLEPFAGRGPPAGLRWS